MGRDEGDVGELGDRFRVTDPRQGLEVDAARGFELPLALGPLQREMRLGVGYEPVDEALVKLAVLFDWRRTCAA